MQRVGALATLARNAAIDLFGKGKHGFKPGNAVSGEVPTTPGYEFFNAIQEELASVVEGTGDVLDPGKNNQVLASIKKLIGHFDTNDPHPVYAKKVEFQQDLYSSAIATGTADAIVSAFTPAITATTLASGCVTLTVRAAGANTTTTPTHTPNAGVVAAATIVKGVNQQLAIGDIPGAGYLMILQWDATLSKWVLLNPAMGITTPQTSVQIQSLATPTVLNNALTLAWNPAPLQFRNTVLANGAPIAMSAPGAAVPITIPSGATLGGVSGVQMVIAHLIAYNGGSLVSCVVNMAGGVDLSEAGLISPTTISAAATSASTIYSASAVAPNTPYRVVGYYVVTEATAGVWAAAPALSQGAGGAAMAAMQAFGAGQKWIDFTGSRVFGTTYYNDTLKPITLKIACVGTSVSVNYLNVKFSDGQTVRFCYSGFNTNATNTSDSLTIPAGYSYTVTTSSGGASLNSWYELR